MKRFIAILLAMCLVSSAAVCEGVKILAIGNSFTRNALKYFYPMAKSVGVNDLIVANMHIDGCSLKKHFKQISKDKKTYTFYYQDQSGETIRQNVRMSDVIGTDEWDYITLQQTGGHSGVTGYYQPYLKYMINYVTKNSKNPDFELCWYGTWAYAKKCRHSSFARYGFNQKRMYNGIVKAESLLIYPNDAFKYIIPAGRAIQMIRETSIGDNLNIKDGYHLNPVGCYAVALCWVYTLFGVSPYDVSYQPVELTPTDAALIRQSVARAVGEYGRTPQGGKRS